MILCAVTDMLFSSRIAAAARGLGREVAFVKTADAIVTRTRETRPSAVIFDLNQQSLRPLEAIAALRADPDLAGLRTIGYVSHVDSATIAAARAAGVGAVLARSAFVERLADLLTQG
jgi:CheY-like chemotaxis protein